MTSHSTPQIALNVNGFTPFAAKNSERVAKQVQGESGIGGGTPSDRLRQAADFLIRLMASGVTFSKSDGRLTYSSPTKLQNRDRDDLVAFRVEIRSLIDRAEQLPHCPSCSGLIIASPTFDGFENAACPPCGRWLGCVPASAAAIGKYGQRQFNFGGAKH